MTTQESLESKSFLNSMVAVEVKRKMSFATDQNTAGARTLNITDLCLNKYSFKKS